MIAAILDVDLFGDRLDPGSGAALIVLTSFLVSFLAIRTSARLTRSVNWWPGGVQTGGVHLHHLVWGIGLLILSGFLAFTLPHDSSWWYFAAVTFGIGAGFTLDEFALWVHLEDVYWDEEGRVSFDAVVCTFAFGALVVAGSHPFGLTEEGSRVGTAVAVTPLVALATIVFAKGRVLLGIIGLFVPIVALIAAFRLARPSSPWARWRYDADRLQRAQARFAMTRASQRARRRLGDLIAGEPKR
jgi:hypothetical protein